MGRPHPEPVLPALLRPPGQGLLPARLGGCSPCAWSQPWEPCTPTPSCVLLARSPAVASCCVALLATGLIGPGRDCVGASSVTCPHAQGFASPIRDGTVCGLLAWPCSRVCRWMDGPSAASPLNRLLYVLMDDCSAAAWCLKSRPPCVIPRAEGEVGSVGWSPCCVMGPRP